MGLSYGDNNCFSNSNWTACGTFLPCHFPSVGSVKTTTRETFLTAQELFFEQQWPFLAEVGLLLRQRDFPTPTIKTTTLRHNNRFSKSALFRQKNTVYTVYRSLACRALRSKKGICIFVFLSFCLSFLFLPTTQLFLDEFTSRRNYSLCCIPFPNLRRRAIK